jgi:hypothetical protein
MVERLTADQANVKETISAQQLMVLNVDPITSLRHS